MHFSGLVPRYLQLSHYSQNLQTPIGSIDPNKYESTSVKDSWTGIDKFVEDTLKEWKAPGMAVAIINGDDIEAKVSNLPMTVSDFLDHLWSLNHGMVLQLNNLLIHTTRDMD